MKGTVTRGYLGSRRVLVHSNGRVFDGHTWIEPQGTVTLHPGDAFERWVDVPAAWLGKTVWWK